MGNFPQHPSDRRAAVVLAVALVAFLLLLGDLLGGGPLTRADPQLGLWFAQHRVAWITQVLFAVTQLHGTLGIDCMLVVVAAVLLVLRRWRPAVALVLCVQGAMLLNVLLKTAFARARPDSAGALVHLLTYSFPSGHALAATVWLRRRRADSSSRASSISRSTALRSTAPAWGS
jgi:membrane-associated phospholipid phosphatase